MNPPLPSSQMDPSMLRRTSPCVEEEVPHRYVDFCNAAPPSTAVRGELRNILRHSLVFAVVITALLFYSGGQQVLSWTMSLLVILYLFCCCISYSTAATPLAKIFYILSYLALVAFCVSILLNSVLGLVLVYLDSLLAAGLFGSVLAQHRESKFTELAAFLAAAKAPLEKYRRQLGIYTFLALFVLFYASVCISLPVGDYRAINILMTLFGAVAFLQFLYIDCLLGWLNGAVFGDDSSTPIFGSFAAIGMLFMFSYLLAGELVAAPVLWLCVLVSTAFLGYYERVHATYETMMITRDAMLAASTPKHKED